MGGELYALPSTFTNSSKHKGRGQREKKTFSFGHCPNYLNPPPHDPNGPLFSEVEIQDLKVSLELKILYILYNILYICNLKTVKSSIHWHF